MKRLKLVLLALCIIITNLPLTSYAQDLEITSKSVVLMDPMSKRILDSAYANEPIYPGSTTMLLTALVAVDHVSLDEMVTVTAEAKELGMGAGYAFAEGERLSVEDLIAAMLLESSADAAFALAYHIGETLGGFSQLMNDKAKELGMTHSKFINPSGLHDPEHVTTAYDMALLTSEVLRSKILSTILTASEYTIAPTNAHGNSQKLVQRCQLVTATDHLYVWGEERSIAYPGILTAKVAQQEFAGTCLVAAAKKNDVTLVATVFGGDGINAYKDIHQLFDYGFERFKIAHVLSKDEFAGNFTITGAKEDVVPAIVGEDFSLPVLDGQGFQIEKTTRERVVELPLKAGDPIADMDIHLNGELVGTVPLFTTIDVHEQTGLRLLPVLKKIILPLIIALFVLFFIMLLIRRRNMRKKIRRQQRLRQKRLERERQAGSYQHDHPQFPRKHR